jgi:hypothetical protein
MDKVQAINSFWNGFGIPAYDETTVPDNATMPYITYSVSTANIGSFVVLNASLWYRSTSWAEISKKAAEIAQSIGYGYKIIPFDGGKLMLTLGTPFERRMAEPDDKQVRRIILNVTAEFLSEY